MSKIYYYTTISNNNPVKEFIESLNKSQTAKVARILKTIEQYGIKFSFPYTRKVTGTQLWGIRILGQDNIRVIHAVIYRQDILLLHGFLKKKQKTPKKDLDTALNRYKDWLIRLRHVKVTIPFGLNK